MCIHIFIVFLNKITMSRFHTHIAHNTQYSITKTIRNTIKKNDFNEVEEKENDTNESYKWECNRRNRNS